MFYSITGRRWRRRSNESLAIGEKKVMTMVFLWDQNKVFLGMKKQTSSPGIASGLF